METRAFLSLCVARCSVNMQVPPCTDSDSEIDRLRLENDWIRVEIDRIQVEIDRNRVDIDPIRVEIDRIRIRYPEKIGSASGVDEENRTRILLTKNLTDKHLEYFYFIVILNNGY